MNSSNPDSFGTMLKGFRTRRGLTQHQLAEKLGVRRNTIGTWERGDFLPQSKGIVLELARHLLLDEQEARQLLEASLTALAPHWSVPLPRNPYFTGREEILEVLHTQLDVNQVVALTHSSALHGLGGVGKTQIALEYTYHHALEYSAVFWIGAETEEQVVSGFLHIAEVLHLPERAEHNQQRVIAAVQRWLISHGQWLMIWDNVEDLTLLDRFLPSTRSGAILLTTRCQALGTLARGVDLSPMEQDEALLILLRRAKVLAPDATEEQVRRLAERTPAQYAAAVALVERMAGLPLALDQAGAYIEEAGCGLAGYLHRYEQQGACLLDRRGNLAKSHPHSVATTFKLLMERVAREQPAAADLLRLCCWLHADAIPEELFVDGAAHLGPALAPVAADLLRFDQAIAALRNLSLIQRQPERCTISLHRLIQTVLRETLDPSAARLCRGRVIQALAAAFPEPEFLNWACCERFVSHVQQVLQDTHQGSPNLPEARDLFSRAGSYLLERAEPLLLRALSMQEPLLGALHPETAQTLHDLAILRQKQGNLNEAISLAERALSIRSQALGDTHPKTITTRTLSAQLFQEQAGAEVEAASRRHPEALPDPHGSERHENGVSPSLHRAVTRAPSEDDPLQKFLDACCELHSRAQCRSADLWQAYGQWTRDHQERFPLSRGAFTQQLKAAGCRAGRTNSARIWYGITLVNRETVTESDEG